jgi:predicted ribosome quality control (RQC) complex YloA/Tae2 family protein
LKTKASSKSSTQNSHAWDDSLALSHPKPRIISYELPGAWTLLVGTSDADNDYLSVEVAEPDDWWFHADNVPGSHVILHAKTDEEPSRETLRQAAAVAAYHSKARNASSAPVHCTRARYVTKPRGAKTGTVRVARGKVLKVRPDISFAARVPAPDLSPANSNFKS